MAVIGTHALLYTSEPEALRACLRDAFGWHNVDAHDGWLIFALPPAELGVHPADAPAHELSFMCDDINATMAELRSKGVVFAGEPRRPRLRCCREDGAARRRRRPALRTQAPDGHLNRRRKVDAESRPRRRSRDPRSSPLVQNHLRFAEAVEARCRNRARATAHRPAVVGLTQAVPERELTPVARVRTFLQLVRAEDRGRRRAHLADPLGLVGRARAGPVGDALLLEQPDGVLAQPATDERVLIVEGHVVARDRSARRRSSPSC